MTTAETEWGSYCFKISDFVNKKKDQTIDITYSISFEPIKEKLQILGNGFLGLQLYNNISFNEAEQLEKMLNKMVEWVAYTNFNELLSKTIDETDLDEVNKNELKEIAPNLTTDTTESDIAISKFKRILSIAGEKSQEMVENILAKAIAETLKTKYFG